MLSLFKKFKSKENSIRKGFESFIYTKDFTKEKSILKIVSISKNTMKVESSYKIELSPPGMNFTGVANFPFEKAIFIAFKVLFVEPSPAGNSLLIDLEITKKNRKTLDSLSRYLLLSSEFDSINENKEAGFNISTMKILKLPAIVAVMKIIEVLRLRRKAYTTRVKGTGFCRYLYFFR